MADGIEVVRGKRIAIMFEARKCIHSRACVLTRPDVFVPNAEGEWIHPDAASSDAVARIAHECPSGAIRYERLDGGEMEHEPIVNLIRLRENGPLAVNADIVLDGNRVGFRATLCRCGASKNKPYCDTSHIASEFKATGEPPTKESSPLAARGGVLNISSQTDGPLLVEGNVELVSGTGRTTNRTTKASLCRCGHSANKPYCDGTHKAVRFKSD
jgi:CDGSH-type Zn-finger protein/uncharacterized Fe-S cluster protein YjdI